MVVGLGTGTTAAFAIHALGRRVAEGLVIEAVATSEATARAARAAGVSIRDLADIAAIDLCIDGVDEIDPSFAAIKGAGGAMLREKIVASAARRMIAIADGSKAVDRLGGKPVPVEVLPSARAFVAARIGAFGGAPLLRRDAAGDAWRTDQGNIILDCRFAANADYVAVLFTARRDPRPARARHLPLGDRRALPGHARRSRSSRKIVLTSIPSRRRASFARLHRLPRHSEGSSTAMTPPADTNVLSPPRSPHSTAAREDGSPARLAIDTIRTLAMDAVQKANSGHPGTPMSLAPIAHTLWTRFSPLRSGCARLAEPRSLSCCRAGTPRCCFTRSCTSPTSSRSTRTARPRAIPP